jgi:hypothetical protein
MATEAHSGAELPEVPEPDEDEDEDEDEAGG